MNSIKKLHFHSVHYAGLSSGPRLIVLGAVHGNETCGTQAIRRVLNEIEKGQLGLAGGSVTFVPMANPLAYAKAQRMGDRNLNRNLYPVERAEDFEDLAANWLCPLLQQHDVLLDLHSFHTQGEPFVMLGPQNNTGNLEPFEHAAKEEAMAVRLGVTRFVDGWLDTYARGVERRVRERGASAPLADDLSIDPRYGVGTTEYMRSVGGYGFTLECGQHDDPAAPDVAYRAIHNALAFLGISNAPRPEPVVDRLEVLRLYEVVDKTHARDAFAREWASFDRLSTGDIIGVRGDGTPVLAECDCFIVFPNPNALAGQEWFYLARAQVRS